MFSRLNVLPGVTFRKPLSQKSSCVEKEKAKQIKKNFQIIKFIICYIASQFHVLICHYQLFVSSKMSF